MERKKKGKNTTGSTRAQQGEKSDTRLKADIKKNDTRSKRPSLFPKATKGEVIVISPYAEFNQKYILSPKKGSMTEQWYELHGWIAVDRSIVNIPSSYLELPLFSPTCYGQHLLNQFYRKCPLDGRCLENMFVQKMWMHTWVQPIVVTP